MTFDKPTESNFLLFAMHHYDNPQCESIEEFNEDFSRFKYIRKLLSRFMEDGELRERLLLNHLTILKNVFGVKNLIEMLRVQFDYSHYPILKSFLIFMECMVEVDWDEVSFSKVVMQKLKSLDAHK